MRVGGNFHLAHFHALDPLACSRCRYCACGRGLRPRPGLRVRPGLRPRPARSASPRAQSPTGTICLESERLAHSVALAAPRKRPESKSPLACCCNDCCCKEPAASGAAPGASSCHSVRLGGSRSESGRSAWRSRAPGIAPLRARAAWCPVPGGPSAPAPACPTIQPVTWARPPPGRPLMPSSTSAPSASLQTSHAQPCVTPTPLSAWAAIYLHPAPRLAGCICCQSRQWPLGIRLHLLATRRVTTCGAC